MARIPSPNPDFAAIQTPGLPGYSHPVDRIGGSANAGTPVRPIPMAFQVASPFNRWTALMPHALVLHVNPTSLQETHTQKVERIQTRGGFVEQHWGHELVEISADASTGAFMNIRTGLTSVLRQRTIAWDRFRDLHDLYRNNGAVHDPQGNIVLQGSIILMYDRGIYFGGFRNFSWDETEESPFSFKVSWTFKVEATVMNIDASSSGVGFPAPSFQTRNNVATAANASAAAQNAGVQGLIAAQTPEVVNLPVDDGSQ